jgi:hypothetical protein
MKGKNKFKHSFISLAELVEPNAEYGELFIYL